MSSDDAHLADALQAYAQEPMQSGDAVLFLDGMVCMEVSGLADHWDDVLRRNLAGILRERARQVVLAIARPGRDLSLQDFGIWRELHQELRGSDVDLLPVKALPAA